MAFGKVKPVPAEYAQNAVLYCRYSSDKQTENSIDAQLRACKAYCDNKGLRVVGEYIDRAISGTTDHRPDFQRMIADAKKQQFAFIIVYRFDRFARNRYDSALYKKDLEALGIRVLSTEESIGVGDEGIILESIYEAMAESYSRRLSKVVTRGMRETAMKGLSTGGNLTYGFRIEDHRITVDEKAAPAIVYAFEAYAGGMNKKPIADELNRRGYRTKTGKPFNISAVHNILIKNCYTGNYGFLDIERPVPAIVSPELVKKVHARIEKEKKNYGHKTSDIVYSLSGKLFCGYCGAAMIGDSGTSRSGERHAYYTCGARKKSHACNKKSEKRGFIEWYVCEQTIERVLGEYNIPKVAKRVEDLSKKEMQSDDIKQLEKRIADIEKELDEAADSLMATRNPAILKRINEKADLLEAQRIEAETELTEIRLRRELNITAPTVESFLRSFEKGDLLNEDFRRHLINTLISGVYLFDDKVVIYYNINGFKTVSHIDVLDELDSLREEPQCSDSFSDAPPNSKLSEPTVYIMTNGCFGIVISRV